MAYARHQIWHRAGPVVAVSGLLSALSVSGCDDGTSTTSDNTGGNTTTTSAGGGGTGGTTTTAAGGGGTGGTGGTTTGGGGTGGDGITVACDEVGIPLDAAPNPDNTEIYFTALDPVKGSGVYKAPSGGGACTTLSSGDPFAAPFGIATATDGSVLFVADPASLVDDTEAGDAGQIFVVATDGGAPSVLAGSQGLRPRSLDTVAFEGVDYVYFTGIGAEGPGVYSLPAAGGTATSVAAGAGFIDPAGVAVATNGDVYVIDTVALGADQARVLLIQSGEAVPVTFVTGLLVGYPAGVALSLDETTLFVSGFDPVKKGDALIQIDLPNKAITYYTSDGTTDLSVFEEAAGLHRAKAKNSFALVDSKAGGGTAPGKVFSIGF